MQMLENQHLENQKAEQGFAALAKVLGVSVSTLRRSLPELQARGLPVRKIGRLLIFSRTAVLQWLQQGDRDKGESGESGELVSRTPEIHPTISPPTPPNQTKRGRGRPRKNAGRA